MPGWTRARKPWDGGADWDEFMEPIHTRIDGMRLPPLRANRLATVMDDPTNPPKKQSRHLGYLMF